MEPQLKPLVVKLAAQVEQLTAVVAQLQQQREASMAA
jgi:outer membrane murein-binding lipoprotein Lpp